MKTETQTEAMRPNPREHYATLILRTGREDGRELSSSERLKLAHSILDPDNNSAITDLLDFSEGLHLILRCSELSIEQRGTIAEGMWDALGTLLADAKQSLAEMKHAHAVMGELLKTKTS